MNFEMEAIYAYASNGGQDHPDRQWIEHPSFADVYVKNPHYVGPDQPHPMEDFDSTESAEEWLERQAEE